jgi:hypothetical protein
LNNEEIDESAVDKIPIGPGRSNALPLILIDCRCLDGNSVKIEDGCFRWSNIVDDSLILNKSVMNKSFFLSNRLFSV